MNYGVLRADSRRPVIELKRFTSVVFITSAGGTLELFPLDNLQPFLVPVTSVGAQAEGHAITRPATPTEARPEH